MRPQILKYYFARSADVEEGGSSMGRNVAGPPDEKAHLGLGKSGFNSWLRL